MTFLQLMQWLEAQLGAHQWPLNRDCRDLRSLFETCALHHDLATRLARAIYQANHCRRPCDPVSRADTLGAVIPIRLEVLRAGDTDIDVFRFIETFCENVDLALKAQPRVTADPPANMSTGPKILRFPRTRVRSA